MSKNDQGRNNVAKLGDFMCFAIYSTNLAYSRVYKPVLEQLGLTYPQYVTIISLWEQDRQTVKGLSESLFLEPSTLTPMLKRLEATGYVRRERDMEDERSVRVSLTDPAKGGRQFAHQPHGSGQPLAVRGGEALCYSPSGFTIFRKARTTGASSWIG
jgi:hypothetical protein